MTDWTISACGRAHLGEIADLVNAAYRGEDGVAGWTSEIGMVDGRRTTSSALEEDLVRSTGVSIFALRDAKDLLACVRFQLATGSRGEPVCHIGMLAVRPRAQDRGLGRALLSHAEAAGQAAGAQTARMTVVSVRESLIEWYERQGYRRTGEREPFPYDDGHFGAPLRLDLEFVVLEKHLGGRPTGT